MKVIVNVPIRLEKKIYHRSHLPQDVADHLAKDWFVQAMFKSGGLSLVSQAQEAKAPKSSAKSKTNKAELSKNELIEPESNVDQK